MKCACCGRKKKLLESYEDLGKGGCVCKECSILIYKIHDAVTEKDIKGYEELVNEIRSFAEKYSTKEYIEWFESDYLQRNKME